METGIRQFMMIGISIFEVWLCYQWLFYTEMKKEYFYSKDKIFMGISILIIGSLLGINRTIFFFSLAIFILTLVLTSFSIGIVKRKENILMISLVLNYYTLVALVDFFFAFVSMIFLKQNFFSDVFLYSETWYPVLIFSCSRIFIFIIFMYIKNKFNEEIIIEKYCKILVMMDIFLVLVLRVYQIIMVEMVEGVQSLDGKKMSMLLLILLVMIALAVNLFLKSEVIKKENDFLNMQETLLFQKYQEIENGIEQNRCLVHDMKHDMLVLKDYAKEHDYDSIQKYIEQWGIANFETEPYIWTQNKVWDLIFQQKRIEAERKGITMTIESMLIKSFPLNEREGCVLWGNLLDNAIEACEKIQDGERWIYIKIEKQNEMLFIEIANSIDKEPVIKRGELVTTKSEKSLHGYGIKSVTRIVEKYDGIISYQAKGKVFKINVTFGDMNN